MRPTPRHNPPAFTLIELMVVVSIIVALIAITFPTLAVMRRQSAEAVAVNTVTIASATARGYSNRPDRAFLTDLVATPIGGPSEQGIYSGYAVIFTPSGEARIVENFEGAYYDSYPLERIDGFVTLANLTASFHADATATPPGNGNPDVVPNHLNGFLDGPITEGAIEYIEFPADAGYCGIVRVPGSANDLALLVPPPFAVWYDESGQLVSGNLAEPDRCVFYDGNYDGNYNIFDFRGSGYNPDEYDPSSPDFDQGAVDTTTDRFIVPFERLETVVGVWTYSKDRMRSAIEDGTLPAWTDMSSGTPTSANERRWEWLRENGQLVMFSRQAGTPMRSSDE